MTAAERLGLYEYDRWAHMYLPALLERRLLPGPGRSLMAACGVKFER